MFLELDSGDLPLKNIYIYKIIVSSQFSEGESQIKEFSLTSFFCFCFFYSFIYLFIGCVGSSLLRAGFL